MQLSRSIEVFEVAAVQEIGTQSCTELTGLQLILMKNIAIEGESIRKMLQRVHMKIIHSKKEIRCLKLNKPPISSVNEDFLNSYLVNNVREVAEKFGYTVLRACLL